MGESYSVRFMYTIVYLEWNNIGDEGCKHLSRVKWNNLTQLDLSKLFSMKNGIKLPMKAAGI